MGRDVRDLTEAELEVFQRMRAAAWGYEEALFWEARDLVRSLSYKPGWTFTLVMSGTLPALQIDFGGPDSGDPSRAFQGRKTEPFPPMFDRMREGAQRAWLKHAVLDVEVHEVDEWLRVDGERLRDPHAPATPRVLA